jgi:adenosylcobinamide-phosphate guanylyltransferase
MCGGRGTRLDTDTEKPLYRVGGEPMIDRVLAAVQESRVETVYAVGSPHTSGTREHVTVPWIEAPGEGYVADLQYALDRVEQPVLTLAADLPLLDGEIVNRVLDAHGGGSLSVVAPAALKRQLGVSADTVFGEEPELAPTGVNVVGEGGEDSYLSYDARVAVNVNHSTDAPVAEALL